jgi:hypothetical protein
MGSVKHWFRPSIGFGNDIYDHEGGLFDKGCVDNWAAGFDKRGAHVQEFREIGVISGVNQTPTGY